MPEFSFPMDVLGQWHAQTISGVALMAQWRKTTQRNGLVVAFTEAGTPRAKDLKA